MAVVERLGGCCHGFMRRAVRKRAKSRINTVTEALSTPDILN